MLVGQLVLCIQENRVLEDLTLAEYQAVSRFCRGCLPSYICNGMSCKRNLPGGPAKDSHESIEAGKAWLTEAENLN